MSPSAGAPGRDRPVELPAELPERLTFADLHVHSRYSRATSPQMTLEGMAYWARRKGLQVVGTGDFTHPEHFRDLSEGLEPDPSGFYRLRGDTGGVRFVPTAETSHMYKQGGKGRRVHMVLVARNLKSVQEINRALASRGNVAADGRPILGFSARHLCKLVREIDPDTLVIPAHIWTPWFSVLGERSGFDSLAECFEEELPFLAAAETGLSSDPAMNWRLSQLDGLPLVSNSDAHSPSKLGRECNAFAGDLTWDGLARALRGPERDRLLFTVEFFPEEGKYHWPGHSQCGQRIAPDRWLALSGRCPVCGKPLTGGVASRVEALADREHGRRPPAAAPGVHLVPLDEIIAEALGRGPATRGVQAIWDRLIEDVGPELEILLRAPLDVVAGVAGDPVAEGVRRMRAGEIRAEAGYDGVYGKIRLFAAGDEPAGPERQLSWLASRPSRKEDA